MDRQKSLVAMGLEVAPGTLFQTWGIGHLYAGQVGTGLTLMISYWVLQAVNAALLMPIGVGFITAPLIYLAYLFFATTNLLSSKQRY